MRIPMTFTSEYAAKLYGGKLSRAKPLDAGADLRAVIERPMIILPGEQAWIPTGIKLDMSRAPMNIAAIAMPRSGRGSRDGLVLGNTIGLCDQGYQGEILLCVWARPTSGHINAASNRMGGSPLHIEPGERIAQLVTVPIIATEFDVVAGFESATERGEGGFGSTGTTALEAA